MRLPLVCVAGLLMAAAAPGLCAEEKGASPVAPARPFTVANTEVRDLPRTRADRQYQLIIGLPGSFKTHPDRKYPVVFVCDGYWNFITAWSVYGSLVYDQTVPEMIVVGLGYAGKAPDYGNLRLNDLCPTDVKFASGMPVSSGQAAHYLKMIETEAIPLLEREYRADPKHRILMGASLGGCFALYTLYTKPELFEGYVAGSPSISPVWQFEDDFARSGRTTEARVFIGVGADEARSHYEEIVLFTRRLATRSYLLSGHKFLAVENMRHAGQMETTYAQGLQYVCAPEPPSTGSAVRISPMTAGVFMKSSSPPRPD